jgi:hypothetical protein
MQQRVRIAILSGAMTGVAASASHGQVFFRVVESEVATTSGAQVHVLPTPLVASDADSDTSQPFPDAQTEAEVGGGFGEPRASSTARATGRLLRATTLSLDAHVGFDLESSTRPSPPVRVASGSWSQFVRFEIVRAARLDLSINPRLFDDVAYSDYTPGTLTGPDGVVVSGPPSPGTPSWIWQLTLPPGEYTFEAGAAFEAANDGSSRMTDSATHSVNFSLRSLDCLADFDGDGALTIFDFLLFQNLFDAGASEADLDDDGELTIFDFLAYQNLFDAGCP